MNETETLTEQQVIDAGLMPERTEMQQADDSYVESDCHYWKETKLEPFSSRRQMAAQCLGFRFVNLSKEEMLSGLEGRGYPDMMQDAVIVLYLCFPRGSANKATGMSQSIDESYAACNPSQRERVRQRMLVWAEDQGIEICSPTLTDAGLLMAKIINEEIINRFKLPAPKGSLPSGNS